jgi:hypothetical protein
MYGNAAGSLANLLETAPKAGAQNMKIKVMFEFINV